LKFGFLQTDWEAQNFAKTTHKITHQELFPAGVESGPGHHIPKHTKPFGAFCVFSCESP
jgi:hypothetical protein